jgi:Protein of unknown function (DUF1559)
MRHRHALSRIEIIVALLIAVLVTGLILGGIARIREDAKVAKCRSNLRQLGIAVYNYIDTHDGPLPPLADQGKGAPTGGGLPSVFATLIPFIEASPLIFRPERPPGYYHAHSSVVFEYSVKGMPFKQDGGVANTIWRIYIDPADVTADKLRDVPMTLPDGSTGYYATGSYAANGLLTWNTGSLPQSFPKGTQNTILMAERPQVCRTAGGDVVYNLWGLGFYSPHMPAFAALTPGEPVGLWSTGQVAPVEPLPDEGAADRDARIRVRIGRRDATPVEPDFKTPVQLIRGSRPCDPRLPASPHLAGMQVLMADGSVRVFAPDTTPWVFWSACMPGRTGDSSADGP